MQDLDDLDQQVTPTIPHSTPIENPEESEPLEFLDQLSHDITQQITELEARIELERRFINLLTI